MFNQNHNIQKTQDNSKIEKSQAQNSSQQFKSQINKKIDNNENPVYKETLEEKKLKKQLSQATDKISKEIEQSRLKRVDEYIKNIERKIPAKQNQDIKSDVDIAISQEKKQKRLKEAIKNNLTGYKLEKEL